MKVDVILGLQRGDEGKGKVVDCTIKEHLKNYGQNEVLCMRFNGGSNAGHCIMVNGKEVVTHQIPSGVLQGTMGLISVGCAVDPDLLQSEIKTLEDNGFKVQGRLFVAQNAHVVTLEHKRLDENNDTVGSTKRGIGPCYTDKVARCGKRASTLKSVWQKMGVGLVNAVDFCKKFKVVVCEGAQGYGLDIDYGSYPYVTSSVCNIGSVCQSGIPPQKISRVLGVAKVYETYLGHLDFESKTDKSYIEKIRLEGKEVGNTTGRKRQINWLNTTELKQACELNGVTTLILNKWDILQKVNVYKTLDNSFETSEAFKAYIENELGVKQIIWSDSPEKI